MHDDSTLKSKSVLIHFMAMKLFIQFFCAVVRKLGRRFWGLNAIYNFRIKHYWITSKNDASQKYETYSNADPNSNYKLRKKADEENYMPVEKTGNFSYKPLCTYGLDCFYFEICIINLNFLNKLLGQ